MIRSDTPAGAAHPLIVLALGAFEADWLHRRVAEGRLPFLASLIHGTGARWCRRPARGSR